MKKYIVYFVALLWILAGIQLLGHIGQTKKDNNIEEAFSSFQIEDPSSLVESSGLYKEQYLDLYMREQILIEIAGALGIHTDYEIKTGYENNISVTQLNKVAKQATTELKFVTLEKEAENNVIETSQYIMVSITIEDNVNSALYYKNIVDDLMENYTTSTTTTMNLMGSYEGELSLSVRDSIADSLLQKMEVKVVTENRSLDLYTIYGYTNAISEYKVVNYEKINFNIVFTYNEVEDKTLVYVATPIAYGEY